MQFDTYTYTIGAHFLPALINADDSGLSDDESRALLAFELDLPGDGHWSADDTDSSEFARCDVTGTMGAVVVCQYHAPKE